MYKAARAPWLSCDDSLLPACSNNVARVHVSVPFTVAKREPLGPYVDWDFGRFAHFSLITDEGMRRSAMSTCAVCEKPAKKTLCSGCCMSLYCRCGMHAYCKELWADLVLSNIIMKPVLVLLEHRSWHAA